MENEFYLQQQSLCNINSYFNNTNGNGNGNNWDSSFHSSLTSSVHPTQAPLISTDPEFAERAARFSMFGRRSFNGRSVVEEVESELGFPRVSSCQGLKFPSPAIGSDFVEINQRIRIHDEVKMNGFSPENGEESSVSEPQKSTSKNDLNPRKRKSNPRAKNITKNNQIQIQELKRTKSDESNENGKNDEKAKGKSKDDSTEPPKDYIHVRARRGQATDSHSLAERVRREKISKRMKFLQDLVPGCNKVTGKAVMLDEIINYVQSLQRQVEFLSMKLSTLNPTNDINVEALLSKDLHQARSLLSQSMFALESSPLSPAFPYSGYSSQIPVLKKNAHSDESESSFSMNPLTLTAQRPNHAVQFPSPADGFDQSASQVSMWIDELHNVVQMGYGQNELQDFQGSLTTSDMKMEQ